MKHGPKIYIYGNSLFNYNICGIIKILQSQNGMTNLKTELITFTHLLMGNQWPHTHF